MGQLVALVLLLCHHASTFRASLTVVASPLGAADTGLPRCFVGVSFTVHQSLALLLLAHKLILFMLLEFL